MENIKKQLQDSPFFEAIESRHLDYLCTIAKRKTFTQGELLVKQDDPAEWLYLLCGGRIKLFFLKKSAENQTGENQVLIRNISDPGSVIGWSAMVEPYHYRDSAEASMETEVLGFERETLEAYAKENSDFGIVLMERILWLLGNRLRETRIRLIARRYESEVMVIRALLDQNAEQLSVSSPLHKIPFYLENRLTLSDAFQVLESLKVDGNETERNVAQLCVDLLQNVRRELTLYHQLQLIYDHVADAPASESPSIIRRKCSEDFVKLFESIKYSIKGLEKLPGQSGHIFIMNHLDNHPDNTLPNAFRLTMDTHFVASMILFKKYGQAPIRVIRKSHPDEYGHQKYFDRLGYIYVYSKHVDEDESDPDHLAEQRRRLFLENASAYLREGNNILMCPEGACTSTEHSPKPFKAGAFRLAAHAKPEPLIVPVAVANFDKKLTKTTVNAVVHDPIRLSDLVTDLNDDQLLYNFINNLNHQFRNFVQEAANLHC